MSKKLSPIEEALKHDREMDERSGIVSEPTRQEKKTMLEKQEELKVNQDKAKVDLLKKFVDFLADPLSYLHSQVSKGEWEGKEERYELYSLLTQVKIQESLQGILEELKKGKK